MSETRIPLSLNAIGTQVEELHKDLVKLGYIIPDHELDSNILGAGTRQALFGVGTQQALISFQTKYNLRPTGILDKRTIPILARAVTAAESEENRIEGQILFDNGLPAVGISVRVYTHRFGGEDKIGEVDTDDQGFYSLSYGGDATNLEVRTLNGQGEKKEISLSTTKYNAEKYELINLVAPSTIRSIEPEYKRLTEALVEKKVLESLDQLATAKENVEQRDLTILHQATGWDARLIALAATAIKVRDDVRKNYQITINPETLYALFRLGLPTDVQQLSLVSRSVIEEALKKANSAETGIVALKDTDEETNKFIEFAQKPGVRSKFRGHYRASVNCSTTWILRMRSGIRSRLSTSSTVVNQMCFGRKQLIKVFLRRASKNCECKANSVT